MGSGMVKVPAPMNVDQLGDFPTRSKRVFFLSLVSALIGVAGALVASALLYLIGFFTNLFFYGRISFTFVSPALNQLGYLEIVIPVSGGLIIGIMARYGSERIRGHGIPEALESILINKSRIEPKVTFLKPVATAISIGSGGPFGAEGPIIMTGGSLGSLLGQMLKVSSLERRTLLVAGAAAGMAATFNAPLAAILIAVELLLFEWRPRSLIPVGLASISATVVRWVILGNNPLFPITQTPTPDWVMILSSVVVGLVAGAASTVLTYMVYASEDVFRKIPIHWMWWPVIGGLVIGVGGLIAPKALGVGYDTIDLILLGKLAISGAAVLLVVKSVIWSVSLGSGTSGGVLAPLLMLGGALGSLEAQVLFPSVPSLWAAVSMGAILGGTMRAPFTGIVFTLELTHDINALPPLIVGAVIADFVTVFTMKRSILTEKVARRGVHVIREYGVDVLEQVPVEKAMHTDFETIPNDMKMSEVAKKYHRSSRDLIGYPVVDQSGSMVGYLARERIEKLIRSNIGEIIPVGELVSPDGVLAFPDEPMRVAIDRMAEAAADSMPVVKSGERLEVIGLLSKEDPFRARVNWFREENLRERHISVGSWLEGLGKKKLQENEGKQEKKDSDS